MERYSDILVAIDFSDRILITNPTAYHLGRAIVIIALVDLAIGGVTYFLAEDFLLPSAAWCILAGPKLVIGTILIFCGLTKP